MIKVNGKTLPEIFRMMPWQEKVIVSAGSVFIIFALFYLPWVIYHFETLDSSPTTVEVPGLPGVGMMDPSLASDGDRVALAFSYARTRDAAQPVLATEVGLATSKKGCDNFTFIDNGFAAKTDELIGPDGMTPVKKGVWRVETPSLVYDADDRGKEWKLYAYKYFWGGDANLAKLYSIIVMRESAKIDSGWSDEKWLFSASDSNPPAPYGQMMQYHLNNLSPALKDIYFYARPSVIYMNGVTLMSLSAFKAGEDNVDRVILLASTDHGKSWRYLGAPLTFDDVRKMGYARLAGASLIEHDGQIYLAAVFGDRQSDGAGSFIFTFDNVAAAALARGRDGLPLLVNKIARSSEKPTKIGGGFAAFSDDCKGSGVITSEFSGLRNVFTLMRSKKPPTGN